MPATRQSLAGRSVRRSGSRPLLVLAVGVICTLQAFPWPGQSRLGSRVPGLALAEGESPPQAGFVAKAEDPPTEEPAQDGFLTKVIGAAAQGATAAMVAAILSACTEPVVNRLLVKRMTFSAAMSEITFDMVSKFFLTTFPTNMLKFPIFEVINMMLSFTALSGSMRGIVNGWLFCTIMLPVTNYRFRKSMGWEIKVPLLYQAYVPTVTRDIVYGWARGFVGSCVVSSFQPESFVAKAFAFGVTVFAACIISSPGNEWRGYTLQPKDRKLPFAEYFKPVNYARSTGIGATIMGIALMVGMLATPYAEMLFAWARGHLLYAILGLFAAGVVAGAMKKK
mmetsp:Transcript_70733/g.160653  ORF Transcript_70733/g.160653 Transcript_70733/m.160653 type:complete len:337 (+) Transcript_70733:68-1078(+)